MSYIVAKTEIGKEFLYSTVNCYSVSKQNKDIICSSLNKANYKLSHGEAWKVYDIGIIDMEYTNARFEKMYIRNKKIFIGNCR